MRPEIPNCFESPQVILMPSQRKNHGHKFMSRFIVQRVKKINEQYPPGASALQSRGVGLPYFLTSLHSLLIFLKDTTVQALTIANLAEKEKLVKNKTMPTKRTGT